MPPPRRRPELSAYWIYLVLVLAFSLRLFVTLQTVNLPVRWDEVAYLNHAHTILRDPFSYRDLFRPPLFSALLAVIFRLGGEQRFSVGAFQSLISTVGVALVYVLASKRFARRNVALLAACLFAFYVEFITLPRLYLTETLFITLILGAFLLLERAVTMAATLLHSRPRSRLGGIGRFLSEPGTHAAFCAGILWGLSALTREIVVHFALVVVPVCLLIAMGWRRTLAVVLAFFAGMVLILAPWVARNYSIEGRFVLVGNDGEYTLLRDNVRVERRAFPEQSSRAPLKREVRQELARVPAAQRTAHVFSRVAGIIARAPLQWLTLHATDIRSFWSPLYLGNRTVRLVLGSAPVEFWLERTLRYSPLVLILLAVVGLFVSRDDVPKLLLVLFVLFTLSITFLTHYQPRFRVPLLALGLPEATFGLAWLVKSVRRPHLADTFKTPRLYLALLVLLLFCLLIYQQDI